MSEQRYGYASGQYGECDGDWFTNSVFAYDLHAGSKQVHCFGRDAYTTEPVFAPASADAPEGQGYVLCGVYREREDRSDLVIFDARDIESDPVAVVRLPHRMPHGFHAAWVDGRQVYR